jgi:hypothetical protein
MAEIKVLASPDFEEQSATLTVGPGVAILAIRRRDGEIETIDLQEHLESVSAKTEEEVRSLTGAAGWGVLGSLFLGPTGLLLGALWGGRKQKEVCFAAHLKDSRKFLGVTDSQAFQKLQAIAFR